MARTHLKVDQLDLTGSGTGLVLGTAVGGDQGGGSLNAQALYIDGVAVSAGSGLANVVEDTTPQLGGNLDLNTFAVQASNANGPTIVDEAASSTNPTLIPDKSDLTTGVAGDTNNVYFIVNGTNAVSVDDNFGLNLNVGGRPFNGAGTNAFQIINTDATTSPTIRPNKNQSSGLATTGTSAAYPTLVSSGRTIAEFGNTATDVNYFQFLGNSAGNSPFLNMVGTDTDIDLTIAAKGAGNIWSGAGSISITRVSTTDTEEFGAFNYVNDATEGPGLRLGRFRSGSAGGGGLAGVDADKLGSIFFNGNNDNVTPARTDFAKIGSAIVDASDTTEDGELEFWTMQAGTLTQQWNITETGILEGQATASVISRNNATSTLQVRGGNGADSCFITLDGGTTQQTTYRADTHLFQTTGSGPQDTLITLSSTGLFLGTDIATNTPALLMETPSSTNPSIVPDQTDIDTGIGWNSDGTVSIIGNATESAWFSDTGIRLQQSTTIAGSSLTASTANGPIFLNEAASSTNPTLVPDKSDLDTGVGHTAADAPNIVAGGIEATRWEEASSHVLHYSEVNAGLTASSTDAQGQAPILSSYNEYSTVPATNSVTLPTAAAGLHCVAINNGANTLKIYPATGDDLGAGVNTATTLTAGSTVHFFAYDATNWVII